MCPRDEAIETGSKINGWDAPAKLRFREWLLCGETHHVSREMRCCEVKQQSQTLKTALQQPASDDALQSEQHPST